MRVNLHLTRSEGAGAVSLFDDWPAKEQRIQEGVRQTVAEMLEGGVSVYYGEGDEVVREDPDGRRYVVRLVGDDFEIVREL